MILSCMPFWVWTASSGHASCNTAMTSPYQCPFLAGLSYQKQLLLGPGGRGLPCSGERERDLKPSWFHISLLPGTCPWVPQVGVTVTAPNSWSFRAEGML